MLARNVASLVLFALAIKLVIPTSKNIPNIIYRTNWNFYLPKPNQNWRQFRLAEVANSNFNNCQLKFNNCQLKLVVKGGESPSQLLWLYIILILKKWNIIFDIFFVLILGLRLQRYSTNTKRYLPKKVFGNSEFCSSRQNYSSLNY